MVWVSSFNGQLLCHIQIIYFPLTAILFISKNLKINLHMKFCWKFPLNWMICHKNQFAGTLFCEDDSNLAILGIQHWMQL